MSRNFHFDGNWTEQHFYFDFGQQFPGFENIFWFSSGLSLKPQSPKLVLYNKVWTVPRPEKH